MAPRATILIPSFNHAAFVVDAVTSALAQSEPDVEVLVIDDGSTDDSVARLARLADPRLVVESQDNVGLSRTLNRGLERARGAWVKFLPSDDALEPDCVVRQLAAAAAAPDAGVVFSLPTVVDAAGAPLADAAPQAWFDTTRQGRDALLRGLLERNFLCAPSALFARERALAVGGFDPELAIAQDYDLWLKLLADADGVLLQERLVRVRWHGANQSGVVTAASEAERSRVVLGALERLGVERWVELFRERGAPPGAVADARARLALAGALLRSGIAGAVPHAQRLVAVARAAGVAPEGELAALAAPAPPTAPVPAPQPTPVHAAPARAVPRRGLKATLRGLGARLLRRAAPPPAGTRAPGPRREHWVIVGDAGAGGDGARSRGERLAAALAGAGADVTWVPRAHAAQATRTPEPASGASPRVLPWHLPALRELLHAHDERLRVVLQVADGAAVALAREARQSGARVLYDKAAGAPFPTRAGAEDERALIDAADDLIGGSRPAVKQLAVHRRLVHLLPDAEDEAGWRGLAASLRALSARPTVAVIVGCGADAAEADVARCLEALTAARGDRGYRIFVVDDGVSSALLADLDRRAEDGEVVLLRNARHGRASGRNLALRATSSELVALLDVRHRAVPGWLEAGVAQLLGDRALGAVAVRGPASAPWVWLAPRAALVRVPGFDEAYDPGSFEDDDLERQLAGLGYAVRAWPAPAPDAASAVPAPADVGRRGERHFRRKWRARPHDPKPAAGAEKFDF